MSAHFGLRLSAAAVFFATAAAPGSAAPTPVPTPLKAGMTTSTATHQILGLTILPSAPQPEQPIRVRVDGNGTCKVWFAIRQLEGSPVPLPPSWNPMGIFNELSRPPDATLALPGELPALKLWAGRYKIGADSHEGFKGSNCKGSAELEFTVAEKKPVVVQVQPAAGGALGTTKSSGGPSALGSSPQGQAKVAASFGANATSAAMRVTALSILPSAPAPGQAVHVRVDGAGTCKLWFGIVQLDGPKSPVPVPYSWSPMGVIHEYTRPPDATLALPGELPSLTLGAGRWKIGVDTHEGMKGSNCKDSAELEFPVAEKKPVVVPVQPPAGGALGTKSSGGPSALGPSPQGQAKVAAGSGANSTSAVAMRVTALTILPSAPAPGQAVHVRVDGAGTCKLWFGIVQLDGPKSPVPLPYSWSPMGVIHEYTRPPDATLALPGELPSLTLGAGRWRIGVDTHEGMKGTCKGYADLEFVVAGARNVPSGAPGAAPPLLAAPAKK